MTRQRLRPATNEGYAFAEPFIEGAGLALDQRIGDCWADLCEDGRAEKAYKRVAALHPDSLDWRSSCRLHLLQHNFASARQICESHPNPEGVSLEGIKALVPFFSHHYTEAEKSYTELAKVRPVALDPGVWDGFTGGAVSYHSALGYLSVLKGEETSGRRILEECLRNEKATLVRMPQDRRFLYSLAAIESSLGEVEPAISNLRRAYENGWLDYRSMELDPRFDSIRGDARYRQIADSMTSRVTALRVALIRELPER